MSNLFSTFGKRHIQVKLFLVLLFAGTFALTRSSGIGNPLLYWTTPRFECNDILMTEDEIASYRGISVETLHLLQTQRGLNNESICILPEDKLARAIFRSTNPKPDRPDEAIAFRLLQMRDENGLIPADGLSNATDHIQLMQSNDLLNAEGAGISPGDWTWLGPGNIGGRIRSIVIHPTNPNQMWVGSVSGGIWTTTNGGTSWQPVNDFMANLAVSALVMQPGNPSILYAGTGEGFYNIDGIQGAGVFKSTNGGTTWTQLTSTADANWYYVNRLSISPNGSTILAATRSGIWRSTNGGSSWTQVLVEEALDINFHPTDNTKAIASGWGRAWYSIDGGVTWTAASSLPAGGRVEVEYAPNNPTRVYASVEQNSGEIWRSTNGGQTYSLVSTGYNYLGGQGWYDNIIWVDPTNANNVIVGGIDLWRSTNGGSTLTRISQWWMAPSSAHADHHAIVAHPGFNGNTNTTVYFGNDGGIYRANNVYTVVDNIGWQELNNNLGITQFYGATGNATSGIIIGGTQDNGTLRYSGDTETWTTMFGGDGGFNASDQTDPNYFYGEYVALQIHRSTDGGLFSDWIYNGIPDAGSCANFIAPFILDPNNANTMLAGGCSLWRSTNVKAATPTWSSIKSPSGDNISAIAVAKGNSSIIWVGHNDGSVYKTSNGTAASPTWVRVDNNSPGLPNRFVTRLTIDPNNHNLVYATFGGFSPDNVWRTTNGGTNWTDRTGSGATGLPDAPVRSLVIHPTDSNWIYVGTEVGIFASEDGGNTWSLPHDGPANVSVDELFWMNNNLVAATHGRGLFQAPVNTGSNTAPVVSAGSDQTIIFPSNASLDGTVTDDGLPNPPATVTTTWSKVSGPGTVTFGNASAVDTTASFSATGSYVLRLTANDSALSSSDDITITVNSTPDLMFADSFASCNLSAWSGAVTGGVDLSATSAATLVGNCGMQAIVNDNTALYVSDITPTNEARYRARFYFKPNSIAMASGDIHYLFQGLTGAGTNVFTVQLNNNTGTTNGYRIRTQVFNDATNPTNGTYFAISNATHFIEIDWQAASSAGANNGYITLWIDGVQLYTSPGIDNDTRRVEEVRLGAVAGIDAGTRGTYYFDAFESRRQTYIGPAGTTNTAPVVSAGSDQTIIFPSNASLDGTVTDDGLPNPPATVTTTWSKVSGPGTVTFGNASAVDTTASFSATGSYVLRLTANDSALSSSDDVTITVNSTATDLIIQSITPVPSNPQTNQAVDFSVVIKNQGSSDATGFWVDLFIDTPFPPACSGASPVAQHVPSLAAGATQTLTLNYAGFGSEGVFPVNGIVDTNCNVNESNETNNTLSINVPVGPVDPFTIFDNGFESCDLSAWSPNVIDGGDLSAGAPGLLGNCSMRALIDDNNAIYVTSGHPDAETRYKASFYFDPNSIPMVNGDTHTIFGGYSGTSTLVLRLQFRRSSNLYQVQAALLNDGSSFTTSSWFTISDAPHQFALDWQAATAAGANNGALTLSIDGTQQANLTGVDNDTRRIDLARLGAIAGIDAGTRGTYYFDEFKSSRGDTPPPASVSVVSAFTADGNWNPKTMFVPGDPIQWVLEVQNDTGQDAQIELTFDVRDPSGAQITFWNGIVTTGPGLLLWGLPGTVQSGSDGIHTLFGSVLYQGNLSEDSSTYTVSGGDPIFADSFESDDCTVSPWSACVHDNFDLSFNDPSLASAGNQSMNILIDDNNALQVTSNHPNAESRYRARFYFDPNSIPMVSGNAHFIFYGYNGTSKAVVRVEFRNSSGSYQLRAALLTDSSSWNNSSWFTITDAPHPVEIDWRASTGAGANNGGLTLWIDGIQKADLASVDNDTWRIDLARLGAVAGVDAGTRGTYYFDAFESRKQSYIGPSANTTPSSSELGPVSVPPFETPTSDNTIVETNN